MKKLFVTTYKITVLSEDSPAAGMSLSALDAAIDTGPCVGTVTDDGGLQVTESQMADCLFAAGSSADFFSLGEDDDKAAWVQAVGAGETEMGFEEWQASLEVA